MRLSAKNLVHLGPGADMTATKGAFPSARQAEYLGALADEALAAEDKTAAILSAHEIAAEATAKARIKARTMAGKHREDRLVASANTEKHAQAFVQSVRDILHAADGEREALAALGVPAETLTHASILRRLSRYLSGELRKLGTPTEPRFGEVVLAQNFRPADSWVEAEKQATAVLNINKE